MHPEEFTSRHLPQELMIRAYGWDSWRS